MYEPAFNTLRTQQQLGYVVETSVRITGPIVGLVVIVQSSTFAVRCAILRSQLVPPPPPNTLAHTHKHKHTAKLTLIGDDLILVT